MNLFFSYFGGKYRIAREYPAPRFNTVIEPFAGSAGYSLRYYKSKVHLYDMSESVVGTWEYLIRTSAKEILSLPLVFDDVRDLKICQEAKWLIGWWLNKGGSTPCHIPSAWMRTNSSPLSRFRAGTFWDASVRLRIAKQVNLIRHWTVTLCSFDEIDNERACWFIDPPYERSGHRYEHHKIDYKHLGKWTREREGQVIACGQEGDSWVPFRPLLENQNSPNIGKAEKKSKEVIWIKQS